MLEYFSWFHFYGFPLINVDISHRALTAEDYSGNVIFIHIVYHIIRKAEQCQQTYHTYNFFKNIRGIRGTHTRTKCRKIAQIKRVYSDYIWYCFYPDENDARLLVANISFRVTNLNILARTNFALVNVVDAEVCHQAFIYVNVLGSLLPME